MSKDWVKDIYGMHHHYGVHSVVDNMDKEKLTKYLEFRANFLQEELDELKKVKVKELTKQLTDDPEVAVEELAHKFGFDIVVVPEEDL